MGAGNPLIRSFDENLYSANTYFIDFTEAYESKEESVKEQLDDDENFEDLSEQDIENRFYEQLEFDVDDFRENYFLETEFFGDKYEIPNQNENLLNECSAAFMGSAIIIAQSKDAYILTTTDSEYHHYSLGIIPRFKYDEIFDEIYDEHLDKWDWYQNHNKDFDLMVENKTHKEYFKRLKLFLKTHEPTMRKIHEHHAKQMSSRNGPWMSMPVKTIGKQFKFL